MDNTAGGHSVPQELHVFIDFIYSTEKEKLRDLFIFGNAAKFWGQVIVFATQILKLILSFRTTSRIDRFNLCRKSDIVVSETENTH